jgi:4-aminobutyrate aminotransferase/(S)-3-amino-2-methylpropionate transaminase
MTFAGSTGELRNRRIAAIPRGLGSSFDVYAAHASGAEVWDLDGRRLLDFSSGIAVLNTGHRHPKVMQRVAAQLARFTHTSFQVLPYDTYVELAERLNRLAPGEGEKKTALFSTGAEAIENALKIARCATGRAAFVSFSGAFHGRTMMALSLTGKVQPYKAGFGPFPPDVYHAPFPNAYRGVSEAQSLAALEALFSVDVDPARVAAIVIEPVQGEGGFNVAPAGFLRRLRELCDRHGILLVVDEIQTGFARTGRMFAIEHAGVTPDIMTMAKSLAGGFPLSAVTGRVEVMDAIPLGGLGGTFAGSPVACAAALGVLDVIEEERLCERAVAIGDRMMGRLSAMTLRNTIPIIGELRGLGAMVAIELVRDATTKVPGPELAKAVVEHAIEQGLVLLTCGTHANVIRLLPPLTMTDALIDEGLDILERSLVLASRGSLDRNSARAGAAAEAAAGKERA